MREMLMLILWLSTVNADKERDLADECNGCNITLNTGYQLPLVVQNGNAIQVMFDIVGFKLVLQNESDIFKNQITVKAELDNCAMTFNAYTGSTWMNTTQFDGDECKGEGANARTDTWKAKYLGNRNDEFGFLIERAEPQDSGEWTVDIEPVIGGGLGKVTATFQVWVVEGPEEVKFNDGLTPDYQVDEGSTPSSQSITCEANKIRPPPTFYWTIDDQDINNHLNMNATISTQISYDDSPFPNQYLNASQKVDFIPEPWMDGKVVKCWIDILDDQNNGLIGDIAAEKKEVNVTFTVEAPPVPPSEPQVHPEGSFVEGEEGVVVIYFHSNPGPNRLIWELQGMDGNLTSTETNKTMTAGRYTSEGWKPTVMPVNITQKASTDENPKNRFMATLRISELTADDSGYVHNMTITNDRGSTSYAVRIQTIEGGGLSTGAIAGIVVGVIVGIALVVLAAIMFVRHKNGKKSKKIKQQRKKEREGNNEGGTV